MDKNTTTDRFIAFLLRTIVLAEITPASSIFLILFQQGVDEIPILFEISDKGKPEFGVVPYRSCENMKLYANISYIKKVLHWEPSVNFDQGIREVINWYKSNNEKT